MPSCTALTSSRLVRVSLVTIAFVACCQLSPTNVTRADENEITSVKDEYRRSVLPLLTQYCFACHAEGADEGNFSLAEFASVDALMSDTQKWWAVLRNVRSDVMPPDGEDQPTDAQKRLLTQWITGRVFASSRDESDPGPGTLRRLNRLEYGNTIRDLMGVEFDTSVEFPPDDTGNGFDNNADALSISPLLTEKYVEAAREIVDLAVPKASQVIPSRLLEADAFEISNHANSERISFEEEATAIVKFEVAHDANYQVIVPILINGSFDFNPARARVRIRLDDEVLHDYEYGWTSGIQDEVSVERTLSRGEHSLGFELNPVAPKDAGAGESKDEKTFVRLQIQAVQIQGPQDPSQWKKPDGYERFFHLDTPPQDVAERRQYACEVLRRFCRRAFRGPVDENYLSRLMDVAGFSPSEEDAAPVESQESTSFEQRIGRGITAVLASPRFLFRVEQPDVASAEMFPEVDEFSFASRLSYFLWSTMPDEELLQLAERGELKKNLVGQIERMLRDERSERLIENFVGQWLQVRDVESVSIEPLAALGVSEEYEQLVDYLESTVSGRSAPPEDASQEHLDAYRRYREIREWRNKLDGDVRRDMAEETERLVSYVLHENRSLVELVDADYAFLNERLAKHYGVPGIEGDEIHKVKLPPGSPLGGVLTQGTFLVVTSNPTRTSPVKRGLFILDNILGTPSPPAPAMVPELEASAEQSHIENPTVRQLMELHRSEALCSSCHARFDPLGLAFENFTAIGTWRDQEYGQPVQPAGRLISGESFDNVTELKKVLAGSRRTDFYRCLSERMLSYAIGRSLELGDEIALEQITNELESNQGRAQSLITAIVNSPAFRRMRRLPVEADRP